MPAVDVGAAGLPGANVVKSWKIDRVHNWRELITNGATTTTTTVDAVNLDTTFGAATPVDDNNGNLIAPDLAGGPAVTLNYDFLNRLRRVTSASGGQIEHDYDAEGRRVRTRATNVPSMPAVSEFVLGRLGGVAERYAANLERIQA